MYVRLFFLMCVREVIYFVGAIQPAFSQFWHLLHMPGEVTFVCLALFNCGME